MKNTKRQLPDEGDLVLVRINSSTRTDWLMPQAPVVIAGKRKFPEIRLNTNQDYHGYVLLKYKQSDFSEIGVAHWVYHILLGDNILLLHTSLRDGMINARLTFRKV